VWTAGSGLECQIAKRAILCLLTTGGGIGSRIGIAADL
jgi:hypothetical protein